MNNPDDITWHFLGPSKKKTSGISYKRAKVRVLSTGVERIFSLGDAVHVEGGESDCPWIAQIVEFLDQRPSSSNVIDDPDVEVVDQYIAHNMRCTLRWIYNPKDVPQVCKDELVRMNKHPVDKEFFFSDHVEHPGSNPLEVIEGRAFLASTYQELVNWRANEPEGFVPGDELCLVRMYHNNRSTPPRIRELNTGELRKLLEEPSNQPLYDQRNRDNRYGAFQAVMKGTRKQVSNVTNSPPSINQFVNRRARSAIAIDESDEEEDIPRPPRRQEANGNSNNNRDSGRKMNGRREGESGNGNGKSRTARKITVSDDEDDLPRPPRRTEASNSRDTGKKMKMNSRREDDARQAGRNPAVSIARRRSRVETIEKSGNPPRRRRVETIEESRRDMRVPRKGGSVGMGNNKNIRQSGMVGNQPDVVGHQPDVSAVGNDGFDPLDDLNGDVLGPVDMAELLGSRAGSVPPIPPSTNVVNVSNARSRAQPRASTPMDVDIDMDDAINEVIKHFSAMEAKDQTCAFKKVDLMFDLITENQKQGGREGGDDEEAINQVVKAVFG